MWAPPFKESAELTQGVVPLYQSLLWGSTAQSHAQSASDSTGHEKLVSPVGEKEPLFKNNGDKRAFQKVGVSSTFSSIFKDCSSALHHPIFQIIYV
jgi:hypothetical protein